MSAAKKITKTGLLIFNLFVICIVMGLAIYMYVNTGSLAKRFTQATASQALGVSVTIGDMDINIEELKVILSDITIANPVGYKKPQALHIDKITVAGEQFSPKLLTLARIEVEGTNVNLEVGTGGTNLGDLKKNIETGKDFPAADIGLKVIARDVLVKKTQLNPSVILVDKDMAFINVPDMHVMGVGEEENGVTPHTAIGQVMTAVIQELHRSANDAGFLEGLPLEAMNDIGVSTLDVFNKNLKESAQKQIDAAREGVETLKNMIAQ